MASLQKESNLARQKQKQKTKPTKTKQNNQNQQQKQKKQPNIRFIWPELISFCV